MAAPRPAIEPTVWAGSRSCQRCDWRRHRRHASTTTTAAAKPAPPPQALLLLAKALAEAGRPHRAIAQLQRHLVAHSDDAAAVAALEALLESEHMALALAVPPATSDEMATTPQGNACVRKVDSGSLLFRGGAPRRATPRAGAGYQRAARNQAAMCADGTSRPRLEPMRSVDGRTEAGRAAAVAAVRSLQPIVVRHAGLPRVGEETAEAGDG